MGLSQAVVKNSNETTRSVKDIVAEQLLASQEGLLSVTLVVIYCKDLTVIWE
jgi:hypothetical protein